MYPFYYFPDVRREEEPQYRVSSAQELISLVQAL